MVPNVFGKAKFETAQKTIGSLMILSCKNLMGVSK
jgi:hypothetical protein